MGRKLNEVIASLPAQRRERVDALAQAKVEEMLASARTLADIRKAVGKTQVDVARVLGVKQNAISQLEQRSDTYLSTFKRFLAGMGMHLELSVVTAEGTRVDLSEFRSPQPGSTALASAPVPALAKTLAGKSRRTAASLQTRAAVKEATVTTRKARPPATRRNARQGVA